MRVRATTTVPTHAQCAVLNGFIFLGSILFTNAALFPLLERMAVYFGVDGEPDPDAVLDVRAATDGLVSLMFQLFWFVPLYLISFILSAAWYQDIADKAFEHCSDEGTYTKGSHNHSVRPKALKELVVEELYRLFVVITMLIQSGLLHVIPFVGPVLSFVLTCFLYSFQVWAYRWALEGREWKEQVNLLEQHWLYFMGFGMPCTLLTFFYSRFVAAGVYALIFPAYIMMAIVSVPARLHSRLVPPQLPVLKVPRLAVSAALRYFGRGTTSAPARGR